MRAFKLAADVASEGFSGGTVSYGPHQTSFDVGAALTANGEINPTGVIVADAPSLIQALAQYPALEETEVPAGAVPVEAPGEAPAPPSDTVGVILQEPPKVAAEQVEVTPEPASSAGVFADVAAVHGDEDGDDVIGEGSGSDHDDDDLGIH